jgi:hypothetical protein
MRRYRCMFVRRGRRLRPVSSRRNSAGLNGQHTIEAILAPDRSRADDATFRSGAADDGYKVDADIDDTHDVNCAQA